MRNLGIVSVGVELIHPPEVFFIVVLVPGIADAVQLAAVPVGELRPDFGDRSFKLRLREGDGYAVEDRDGRPEAPVLPGFGAQALQRVDDDRAVGLHTLHDLLHDVLRQGDAAARVGLERAEAVQEDGGAPAGRAGLVEADIEAVLVLVFILDDMLAVVLDKLRIIPDIHHFVVMVCRIAGPPGIVRDLGIGDCAAGVGGDSEGPVEMIDADGCLAAALFMVGIEAQSVFADEAGGGKDLLPAAVFVPLMHGDGGGGLIHAEARHDKELCSHLLRLPEP